MTTPHVGTGYQHYSKQISTGPLVTVSGGRLKWYDIAEADAPVPDAIRIMAIEFLRREADAGRLGLEGDVGFVVLHRCGADFYFLLLSTWRGSNEMWESVYAKQNDAQPDFDVFAREGRHQPTYCVWELGAVSYEQQAWVRFLRSSRAAVDLVAYEADQFTGPVG
jgi:hypothetical protein